MFNTKPKEPSLQRAPRVMQIVPTLQNEGSLSGQNVIARMMQLQKGKVHMVEPPTQPMTKIGGGVAKLAIKSNSDEPIHTLVSPDNPGRAKMGAKISNFSYKGLGGKSEDQGDYPD